MNTGTTEKNLQTGEQDVEMRVTENTDIILKVDYLMEHIPQAEGEVKPETKKESQEPQEEAEAEAMQIMRQPQDGQGLKTWIESEKVG